MMAQSNVTKMQRKPKYNFTEWNDQQETKRDKKKHDRSNRTIRRNWEV